MALIKGRAQGKSNPNPSGKSLAQIRAIQAANKRAAEAKARSAAAAAKKQSGSKYMKPVTTKTPLLTKAPTPSGVSGGTRNTPMIKPSTKLASAGGQTAAQVAFAAKYRRARELEKIAAAAKPRASTLPRTGSSAGSSNAPRPVGSSTAGQVRGPDGVMRTPARQAEMDAWNKKVAESNEIKKKQAQEAQLRAYMAKASTAVQAELMPALNELTRQIASLASRGKKATDDATNFGARAESDITELFGRLGNFTNQVQATNNTAYEGLKSGTSANYDQLRASLGQNFDGAQTAATAENERLGLGGMAQAPIQGMERDQQFLQGLASTDEAALLGGLGQSQQGFNQLMGMASQTAAAEGASQTGRIRNTTQKTLADIMFEMNQGITDIEGQRGDIEATRGEKIRQLAEALADKDYNRNMEQQQMSFEQRLAQARFNLDKQQVEASMQPQAESYEDQLRVAKLEQELAFEAARQQKTQNDEAFRRALAASWPNMPGTR